MHLSTFVKRDCEFSPRVTREVPVEGVEATRSMGLEVEHSLKQEVSFDM